MGVDFVPNESYDLAQSLIVSAAMTISVHFNVDTDGSARCIASVSDTGGGNNYMALQCNMHKVNDPLAVFHKGGTTQNALSSGTISTNTWYHGAGVWNGVSSRSVFLDNVKVTNSNTVTALAGVDNVSVGKFQTTSSVNYFDGSIEELGIWDVALTDSEINSLYRRVSPLLVRPSRLIWYIPFLGNANERIRNESWTVTGTPTFPSHELGYLRPALPFIIGIPIAYEGTGDIFDYTAADWINPTFTHHSRLKSTSGQTVHSRLFDLTDSKAVSGSELSTTSTSTVELSSGSLTLTDGNKYETQIDK